MEAMEAIFTRRSIRHYTPEPVSDDMLELILRAGMAAPSAKNEQPWHFIIIRERSILDAIPQFHAYAEMLREAGLAVVVCGDLRLETSKDRWSQDCSAAIQNMLLAAHALGLGAVWVALYPDKDREEKTRALLRLPDHVIPLAIIPLGYPGEKKQRADRFNPQRIHENRW
jgi:nitroreductase